MPSYHNMRRDPSGNLYVAGSAGGMGVHSVHYTPTPTTTPTMTPTPTRTPTPTPTRSLTPTPSSQSSVFSSNLLVGMTYDNSPNSVGWDGGGYAYSWEAFTGDSSVSLTYVSSGPLGGQYYFYNAGIQFYVVGPGSSGKLGLETPNMFKVPQGSSTTGIYLSNYSSSQTQAIVFLGSSVNGSSTLNYAINVRNNTNSSYRTITGSVGMDDWCGSNPTNTVAISMNRRTDYGSSPQYLTTRIYRYVLATSSNLFPNETITGCRLWNTSNDHSRIFSWRFV